MSHIEPLDLTEIDPDSSIRTHYETPAGEGETYEAPVELPSRGFDLEELMTPSKGPEPIFSDSSAGGAPTIVDRRSGYVAPWKRAKAARRPDPFVARHLRAEVVLKWPLPPKEVLEARDRALRAIDAYDDAVKAVRSLPAEREQEGRENQTAIAVAVRGGEATPNLGRTDWSTEQVVRDVTHDETFKLARQAVADFHRVVRANEGEWGQRIFEGVAPARERAREALGVAAEALREWRAAVDAGHHLAIDTGKFGPDWHAQADSSIKPSVFMGGLDKLIAMAESEDPVVSGSYLTDEEEMTPPLHTRQALARRVELDVGWAIDLLARIEAQDGFRATSFTAQHLRADYLSGASRDTEMRALLANKRLSRPQD